MISSFTLTLSGLSAVIITVFAILGAALLTKEIVFAVAQRVEVARVRRAIKRRATSGRAS